MHRWLRLTSLALLVSGVGMPAKAAGPSSQENSDEKAMLARARRQFQQALALETAGDWAGASGLFEQVAEVRLTPQVRFHIALCEEHLGKLAAALGHYRIAAEDAEHAQATEVLAQVAARTEDLRLRVPLILITRGAGADFASISLDGVVLGASSIGADLPVDPGPHTIDAASEGYRPFQVKIQMAEREKKAIEVVLEPMPAPVDTGPTLATPTPPPLTAPNKNMAPLVLGGAAAVGFATSGLFFYLRSRAISSLDGACPTRSTCPPTERSTYDRGKTYTVIADVALGVGAASAVSAVTLFVLGRRKPTNQAEVQLVPWVGAGASVVGRF